MGFLRQVYDGIPTNNEQYHVKRRRMSGKFAFLKRNNKQSQTSQARRAQDPAINDKIVDLELGPVNNLLEEDDLLGDIPRSISVTLSHYDYDDRLLLPFLVPSAPSLDSIGSPCEMMSKNLALQSRASAAVDDGKESVAKLQIIMQHQTPLLDQNQEVVKEDDGGLDRSLCFPFESMCDESSKVEKERVAKLHSIMQQIPSLDHLSQYIAALSSTPSPDPSDDLPSRALRRLLCLSEHSSLTQQRIDMVRYVSAPDDNEENKNNNTTLIPVLLAFLQRCPSNSSIQHLTLLVLNNLSIPTDNKRLIALEYGGAKMLGRLLSKDQECPMLVIIIVNLAFGDERYPLVDPEDPITRRILNRVVCFLDLW
eukprot:CAMPEP_0172316808 /NCGR_PEP_ID=MMETSP1058-20130122/29570_1 /TAXON_ID=83371 /ORGANISM="Detonula confervacea, Strain CCMP 353" /LENGTH=366 /DNA_ID=CAMNT_0013031217 /DNA_START=75 /DNA_END=1172 /DNA_ORIENTATION=-